MGKVIVKVRLISQSDLVLKSRRVLKGKPRQLEAETLVDTGATRLYLKPSLIRALGWKKVDQVLSQTTNGIRRRGVYEPVRLEILGRRGIFEVVDIDEHLPNFLGQIPLEYLDLVVDTKRRRLIPNPEHGEKLMTDEY